MIYLDLLKKRNLSLIWLTGTVMIDDVIQNVRWNLEKSRSTSSFNKIIKRWREDALFLMYVWHVSMKIWINIQSFSCKMHSGGLFLPSNTLSMSENMMTSSNGNIFRVTGHLCGDFTGHRWIPAQRPVTQGIAVFFDLNARLSKQSWGWWFETPSHPLWRHNNEASDLVRHFAKVCWTCNSNLSIAKKYAFLAV